MRRIWTTFALLAASIAPTSDAADVVEIRPGDHIAIIGNTLADRMQHDGWLEALLHARYPEHDLVIRNLGFSGDELDIRLRSDGFGSPDEWLSKVEADVIFAFFGGNESWAGAEGLPAFRTKLDAFVKQSLARKYNGKSGPRLVLFAPIAREKLPRHQPDVPDPAEANKRLKLYADAMGEVAQANGVGFIDLFAITKAAFEAELHSSRPSTWTFNGLHLTDSGNGRLAYQILSKLTPGQTWPDRAIVDKIHVAVLDKNFTWFNRYRTVDGYSIFGGRADLSFTDGQTNRVVARREMEVLDVMTANRDKAIWAAARGKKFTVDDRNTPAFIPVKTNKPGAGPNGEHLFLSGEESIKRMTVAKNLKVNLFASEETFPELAKPVQMSFDARGRLWVACWPTYPHWKPKEEMDDKLLILEDTDGDGKADKKTVFADRLHCPTGFEFYNGGVLDRAGPGPCCSSRTPMATARPTSTSACCIGPRLGRHAPHVQQLPSSIRAGRSTSRRGRSTRPRSRRRMARSVRLLERRGLPVRAEVAASSRSTSRYGFANPHGHAFDRWGQDFVVDGTGAVPYHATLFSGHVDYPNKHGGPPQVYNGSGPARAPGWSSWRADTSPTSSRATCSSPTSSVSRGSCATRSTTRTPASPGPSWSRSWHRRQTPTSGRRTWRSVPTGRSISSTGRTRSSATCSTTSATPAATELSRPGLPRSPTKADPSSLPPEDRRRASMAALLDLLKSARGPRPPAGQGRAGSPRGRPRSSPRSRPGSPKLDKADPDYEHRMTEALWVHQYLEMSSTSPLLDRVLASPDFHARSRRDPGPCARGATGSPAPSTGSRPWRADPYARVRLEAVRAAELLSQSPRPWKSP